jgi:uncharacterized repeat protein (TIGR01451 family)
MRIVYKLLAALVSLTLGGVTPASQAADGAIHLSSRAQIERDIVDKDGNKTRQRLPVQKAVPATEVIYTTTFENITDKAVGNIVINNPLPNDSEYLAGSATGKDCEIVFSVDSGKSFAAVGRLKVKGVDGKERIALPKEYTHIRWTYQRQLMAGQSGEVGFRTVIK